MKTGETIRSIPSSHMELEKLVQQTLSAGPYSFLSATAEVGETYKVNRLAINKRKIIPKVLRNVENIDTSIQLFGKRQKSPMLLAPIGVQKIFNQEGELASARAASEMGVPFVASTVSSYSLEEIAEATGNGTRWFQLYWCKDNEITANLLKRAEKNGYSAIVLTVDTASFGWRIHDVQTGNYSPLRQGIGLANFFTDPVFRSRLEKTPEEDREAAIDYFFKILSNPRLSWDDLTFLRENTKLPILLKGIVHPDDAQLALDHGVDGIVVSNHGGRQLDGAIGTMDALPSIPNVVAGKVPLMMDSGIRTGSDIVKALALGADSVLVGRPFIYGLTLAGQAGVQHVLRNLTGELNDALALTGVSSIKQLNPSFLTR